MLTVISNIIEYFGAKLLIYHLNYSLDSPALYPLLFGFCANLSTETENKCLS